MEKKISLNINDYAPIETRIYRLLPGEIPEGLSDKFASLANASNEALLNAFEANPDNQVLKKIVMYSAIEQVINLKYADRVSAIISDGMNDEDYRKYLSMVIAIIEKIFGAESNMFIISRKYIMGEDPDVCTSVDLMMALNALIRKTIEENT